MKKVINKDNTLIYMPHYPWQTKIPTKAFNHSKHKAILGIGGNIANVCRRFEHLFWFLKRSKYITILESSPILKNPPFGFINQDDFYNALLLVSTSLTPRELLAYILRVEKRFGRKRLLLNGPRTLDIDIIFYDDIQIDSKELSIPHPQWMKRNSVLIPLSLMKGRP